MEFTDLVPLTETLDDNIDNLEEALEPLLQSSLSDTAGKLPLLDKAQLYVLVSYAIESLLFSYLRLNGVNSKEHPVFREITRVKQYFEKIKAAESAGTKQNVTLNKAAAGRFIKHALAGSNANKKLELDGGIQSGNQKSSSHTRFTESLSTLISNEPKDSSRTVSSNCVSDSDSEDMNSPDGPILKRMKGQGSTTDGKESDRTTKAESERELKRSSRSDEKQGRRTAIRQPIKHASS